VAIWVAAAYLVIAIAIPGHEVVVLALGILVAGCAGLAVLRVAHRPLLAEMVHMVKRIAGRSSPRTGLAS
jgi:PST family polysaccharide transporter